jgi:hypothetical protein
MTHQESQELRKFKDRWAQEKGYEDWYDYKDHCESHGFSDDEIGYDQLMFEYGKMMHQLGKSKDESDCDTSIFASHIQNN